jgi:sterol desaturase/sphingolipid hydroxylase (fatty acid hydroxylase superfamily)
MLQHCKQPQGASMFPSAQTGVGAGAKVRDWPMARPRSNGRRGANGSCMGLLSLEQDRALVRADFAFYGLIVLALATATLRGTAPGHAWAALGWTLLGAAAWTLAEYGLHRYVLHGVQPFKRWHALHHARPASLISAPTLLTAALFLVFVFLPVWWLAPSWRGCAATLGLMLGYLAYIATHHAVHHSPGRRGWLFRQRRWHALHHRPGVQACYGVSVRVWDRVFGSDASRTSA